MDLLNCASANLDSKANSWTGHGGLRRFAQTAHRLRWVVVLIVGFLSVGHFAAATQKEQDILRTKTVIAEKYELPGANGKTSAMLYRSDEGLARLVFFDEKGGLRLFVGMNPDGTPGITMFDEKTKQKLRIGMQAKENITYLYLFDDEGNVTISLSMRKALGPRLLVGRADKGRVSIGLSKTGEPQVNLWAKNDEPRIGLELNDGMPAIRLFDGAKSVRTTWKLSADGSPVFSILDEQSRERLAIGAEKDQHPYIRFIDPDNKTIKAFPQAAAPK